MIGVIGGAGVAATNKLCQLIEELKTKNGAYRDAHHPEMLIWQATQVPSRSMYLEGKGPSWIEGYVKIGKKLKDCGCDELCMCCNTAHYAIETLETEIGIKIINLLDLVAQRVNASGCNKVGMMCSDGLAKVKLYDERFKIHAPDSMLFYPELGFQTFVTKGICNAKNSRRYTEKSDFDNPHTLFSNVVEHLKNRGCECVVAGCTDIRNVYKYDKGDIVYIDSLEVLADYIYQNA